jgi:hypothetical protein
VIYDEAKKHHVNFVIDQRISCSEHLRCTLVLYTQKNFAWLPNVMRAHKINMNAQQVKVKQKIDTKWLVVQW